AWQVTNCHLRRPQGLLEHVPVNCSRRPLPVPTQFTYGLVSRAGTVCKCLFHGDQCDASPIENISVCTRTVAAPPSSFDTGQRACAAASTRSDSAASAPSTDRKAST